MTVTPKKQSAQRSSSFHSDPSPRSGPAQMDDVDGLRLKPSAEDSVSLAEPINLEDSHYVWLRGEIESDALNLEAETWSAAVDQNYVKVLNKEAVKRQDVIYELMQTEMHHVRTLKILQYVYMHELRKSQLIEEAKLQRLFPGLDDLLSLHQYFLNCLKEHQNQCLEEGGGGLNYQITNLGEILISQFSGTQGDSMMEYYSVFCSHHNEALSFYKEQLQNNKKLQFLIKKVGQLPVVRRLGIPECFLLVAQRITKYPVLVERIIQNTEADSGEYQSLVQGLELIKDTIFKVNAQVNLYEKAVRLREIALRLEPKSQGRLKDGRLLRREDLIHSDRVLLHEGTVTWKSSGRQKDVQAVLLSDMFLLLQEKDQKFVFATMDKPPVISLQRLIVREVAHEDKALFLISACTSSMPEMYEIHTSSKEERISWIALIREAVERCPNDEENRELIATLQQFQGKPAKIISHFLNHAEPPAYMPPVSDILKVRDDQIKKCLTEKLQVFTALYETMTEQKSPLNELLHRGEAGDLYGETMLKEAISEVENLLNLLLLRIKDPNHIDESEKKWELLKWAETFSFADRVNINPMKNGDVAKRPGSTEGSSVYNSRDAPLQEIDYFEGMEQSADDDTFQITNCNSSSCHFPEPEVCGSALQLAQILYSLQAVIAQQDTQMELQRAFQSKVQQPTRHYSDVLLEQEKQRNSEKQKEELANLHKLQAQHREEQQRWEKEKERQRKQLEIQEATLQLREEDCRKREEKHIEEKAELERQKDEHQQNLERLRDSIKSVEKDEERLAQEKEKIKKYMNLINQGLSNYDDPTQLSALPSFQSFRGSIVNGGGNTASALKPPLSCNNTSYPMDVPPKVPPRKESISPQAVKSERPKHLFSTTNQVQNPASVQQKIPIKLAAPSRPKEKNLRTKKSHQRTNSAASIDVNQVVPIRVTGNEGGSLRSSSSSTRNSSPQRIYQPDFFKPPGSAQSVKISPSFSAPRRNSSDPPPPVPPPFPKDILKRGKEEVIFL